MKSGSYKTATVHIAAFGFVLAELHRNFRAYFFGHLWWSCTLRMEKAGFCVKSYACSGLDDVTFHKTAIFVDKHCLVAGSAWSGKIHHTSNFCSWHSVCPPVVVSTAPGGHNQILIRNASLYSTRSLLRASPVARDGCSLYHIACRGVFQVHVHKYSYAPHNDVSANDGPHIRRLSHYNII